MLGIDYRSSAAAALQDYRRIEVRDSKYGLVSNDSSPSAVAANDAGLAQILDEAKSGFRPVILTNGTFYTSETLVIDDDVMAFFGPGMHTNFIQTTADPVMYFDGTNTNVDRLNIGGFRLGYTTLQTASTAVGLKLKNIWCSKFERIEIVNAYDALRQVDGSYVFSCTFNDIRIKPYKHDGFALRTSGQSNTGNVINNLYISCGDNNNVGTITGVPFALKQQMDTTVNQLNIEWTKASHLVELDVARSVSITSLHTEGNHLTSNNNGVVKAIGDSLVNINDWTLQDLSALTSEGVTTRNGIVSVDGGSEVTVDGIFYDNQSTTVNCPDFSWTTSVSTSPGAVGCKVRWRNIGYNGGNWGITAIDNAIVDTSSGWLKRCVTEEWDGIPGTLAQSAIAYGDADYTLSPRSYGRTALFSATLTAERAVTISEGSTYKMPPGTEFVIMRAGGGNYDLVVKNITGTEIDRLRGPGDWATYVLQHDYTWKKISGTSPSTYLLRSPRVTTLTVSGSTYTPNIRTADTVRIVDPSADFTLAAPTGTPGDDQKLTVRVESGSTGRAVTFDAIYASSGAAALPTSALPANKTCKLFFAYDSIKAKYVLMAADLVGY